MINNIDKIIFIVNNFVHLSLCLINDFKNVKI